MGEGWCYYCRGNLSQEVKNESELQNWDTNLGTKSVKSSGVSSQSSRSNSDSFMSCVAISHCECFCWRCEASRHITPPSRDSGNPLASQKCRAHGSRPAGRQHPSWTWRPGKLHHPPSRNERGQRARGVSDIPGEVSTLPRSSERTSGSFSDINPRHKFSSVCHVLPVMLHDCGDVIWLLSNPFSSVAHDRVSSDRWTRSKEKRRLALLPDHKSSEKLN